MQNNFTEYQGTPHFQNSKGIQAGCSSCHVPSSGPALLWAKIKASGDVYHEMLGTIETPEKFEARREHMAQAVWKNMKENDSRECRSCHDFANMDLLAQRSGARKYHALATKEKATCIECHKGIAHFLPLASRGDSGPARLLEAARAVPESARQLFAVQTIPLFLSAGDKNPNQGKLMASAPVERIGQEGDLVKVRIGGWRQAGVDRIIYFAPGKRIVNAVLSVENAAKVTGGKTVADAGTGQNWTEASLEAWVEKGSLLDKESQIWDYAKHLMTVNCGTCHGEPDMDHFTANQWIGVIQSMQSRTSMDAEEIRLLTQYSQKHGSDMTVAKK
jgi:trimethylamine-N-oxide reductase cytochrome c-type subunit TorC